MAETGVMLVRDELTGRVYVLTKWSKQGDQLVATKKHDVTDQFNRIVLPGHHDGPRWSRVDG